MEEFVANSPLVTIPAKLKAVIKFGRDEGLNNKLESEGKVFDSWIEAVFAHTQAHYKHPSLGTEVTFEVSYTGMQFYPFYGLVVCFSRMSIVSNILFILIVFPGPGRIFIQTGSDMECQEYR